MHEPLFMQAVESFFLRRTGVGLSLSGRDWQRLRDWRTLGVPATVVLHGLNEALERWKGSTPPHDLGFAVPNIERAIRGYLDGLLPPQPSSAPPPPPSPSLSAPPQPPSWATIPTPSYDAIKNNLARLGRTATSPHVRAALRQSYRAVLDAERRTPRPPAIDVWRSAKAVALSQLQLALPSAELHTLRAQAETSAQSPRGSVSLSPSALTARRERQFEHLLAQRFGLEALLRLPTQEALP